MYDRSEDGRDSGAHGLNGVTHAPGGRVDVSTRLALPDSHHEPAGGSYRAVSRTVAGTVGINLGCPPRRVRAAEHLWPMDGASVPETAVDEHGHVVTRQHQVRRIAADPPVEPKSQTDCVDRPSERDLRFGVANLPSTKVRARLGWFPVRVSGGWCAWDASRHVTTVTTVGTGRVPATFLK